MTRVSGVADNADNADNYFLCTRQKGGEGKTVVSIVSVVSRTGTPCAPSLLALTTPTGTVVSSCQPPFVSCPHTTTTTTTSSSSSGGAA